MLPRLMDNKVAGVMRDREKIENGGSVRDWREEGGWDCEKKQTTSKAGR